MFILSYEKNILFKKKKIAKQTYAFISSEFFKPKIDECVDFSEEEYWLAKCRKREKLNARAF